MADRFGRLLYIGREGGTVTLDLYDDDSEIVGRGFYLGGDDVSILHEVEVSIDRDSFGTFESETGLSELPVPLEDHELEYRDQPTMQITAYQPDPSRKIVAGTVSVKEDILTFQAEEFGSPEPITLIIVGTWALICGGSALHDLIKTCEDKALKVCGEGGVRSVKSKRSWRKLGCSASCEIECREGQTAREDFTGTLDPAGAQA